MPCDDDCQIFKKKEYVGSPIPMGDDGVGKGHKKSIESSNVVEMVAAAAVAAVAR